MKIAIKKVTRERIRELLVAHHGLDRFSPKNFPNLISRLRCIQLDPLDCIGSNADLVAMARLKGVERGEVYGGLFPGHAFEHFAKERCLLPAEAFPFYRRRALQTPWWRLSDRLKRLPEGIVESVLEEVRKRGPISVAELEHRGSVEPIDWSGWKGTASATRMAMEVLWTRCEIVVCGRTRNSKLFDVPERALPHWKSDAPDDDSWALRERVIAAGILGGAGGAVWSSLAETKKSELPRKLLETGALEAITIGDSTRRYLMMPGFLQTRVREPDGEVRILGPLDAFIWDRALIREAFGFDYVWEVYKPPAQRKWGWYVCPLLRGTNFIGRIDAEARGDKLVVKKIWREHRDFSDDVVDEALNRHARACGAEKVIRPRAIRKA